MTKIKRRIKHTGPSFVEEEGKLFYYPTRYPSPEVKTVCGGSWNKARSAWEIKPTSYNIEVLTDFYGPEILVGAPAHIQELNSEGWGFVGFKAHRDLRKAALEHERWEDFFTYQQKGIEYLLCNPHRGALVDLPPGRGKTALCVGAAGILKARKVLVVAPTTLGPDWVEAFKEWYGDEIDVKRATSADPMPGPEVTICHHEVLQEVIFRNEFGKVVDVPGGPRVQKKWVQDGPTTYSSKTGKVVPARERLVQPRKAYSEAEWDVLALDESIMVKNRSAVKLGVLKSLAKYSHNVWLMSGSPTAQGRQDLFPQLQLIDPKAWSSYWRFCEFFCTVHKDQWGWTVEGDTPGVSIHTYLRDYIFTPNPADLHTLPKYKYWSPRLKMLPEQERVLAEMVDEWCATLVEGGPEPDVVADHHLAQQTRLLQITSDLVNLDPKRRRSVSAKLEFLVTSIKDGKVRTPLLVWTWWVPTGKAYADRLAEEFPDLKVAHVHGAMKLEEKEGLIKLYKEGLLDVLVLQMNIGKYGHTLINTQTIYYGDRTFDSDAAVQSLWRTRRVGLKHRPLLIVPTLEGSADDLIDLNLEGKIPSIAEASNAVLADLLRALVSGDERDV